MIAGAFLCSMSPAKNPILFVPGWGPHAIVKMNRLMQFFRDDGYPSSRLIQLFYPYQESLESIRKSLTPRLKERMAEFPDGTRFNVVTHSLGHFVAMHSLLEGKMAERVERYVGLAGIGKGQNHLPSSCGAMDCEALEPLVPFQAPFVMEFYAKHAESLAAWKKCTLYSLDDKQVADPSDTATFADGINVELKGYDHMDFIKSHAIYELVLSYCGL